MDTVYASLVGVISGLVSWWIVARLLTARLNVSKQISKLPAREAGPWRYRVKIVNRTWRQPAVDLKIRASLRVYGLSHKTWSNYPIPIGHSGEIDLIDRSAAPRLQLRYMRQTHRRLFAEHLPGDLEIPGSDEDGVPFFTLEQVMRLGEKTEIRVVISGAHPYTGSRRAVVRYYGLDDIVGGWFSERGVDVVRDDAACR